MHGLFQDCRYAVRQLLKHPGFAGVAILTLALGIGASTAIFSVIENVLLEPFPYPGAERFYSVEIRDPNQGNRNGRAEYPGPEFLDYLEHNRVFDRTIANASEDVLYDFGDGTERFHGVLVTPGTFEFFGMSAVYGRVMHDTDYQPGAPPVFVLRYKTWVNSFAGDPNVIGKNFVLNGVSRTLVGIMPPRFAWGDGDVWLPQTPVRSEAPVAGRFPPVWYLLGHLKPELSVEQATAQLTVLSQRLSKVYPQRYPANFFVKMVSLTDLVVGNFRSTLYLTMAAVGFLLLIGCSNVANLLLARATAREREFAIRSALGSGRRRLMTQLLVESLLLALVGGALGVGLAWAGLKTIVSLVPPDIIAAETVVELNNIVLLFALGIAVITALVFGLAPALQAARKDLNDRLRDSGKGAGSGGVRNNRLRNAVVVVEVALSFTLLVSAGLLMQSFMRLRESHLGFEPKNVLVARLPLPREHYRNAEDVAGFFRPLEARIKALPAVEEVAETSAVPPFGGIESLIEIPGQAHVENWNALVQLSGEGYFRVLKARMLDGRSFNAGEVETARRVAVVNHAFAQTYLREQNPVGRRVRINELENFPDPVRDPSFEIIGVTDDIVNSGLSRAVQPEIWIPYTVTGSGARGILVRTSIDPLLLLNAVRKEVWSTDRSVALTFTQSLEGYLNEYHYAGPHFTFLLTTIFAAVGLILVITGVYSVIAYATARRTQEIGIRMALGASRESAVGLILGMGLRVVGIGSGVGLVASFGVSRLLADQLWHVSAHDPLTIFVVIAILLGTGLLASWIPARRAAKVDPMVALRYE